MMFDTVKDKSRAASARDVAARREFRTRIAQASHVATPGTTAVVVAEMMATSPLVDPDDPRYLRLLLIAQALRWPWKWSIMPTEDGWSVVLEVTAVGYYGATPTWVIASLSAEALRDTDLSRVRVHWALLDCVHKSPTYSTVFGDQLMKRAARATYDVGATRVEESA